MGDPARAGDNSKRDDMTNVRDCSNSYRGDRARAIDNHSYRCGVTNSRDSRSYWGDIARARDGGFYRSDDYVHRKTDTRSFSERNRTRHVASAYDYMYDSTSFSDSENSNRYHHTEGGSYTTGYRRHKEIDDVAGS